MSSSAAAAPITILTQFVPDKKRREAEKAIAVLRNIMAEAAIDSRLETEEDKVEWLYELIQDPRSAASALRVDGTTTNLC
jgi:hypothetical protein